MSYAFPLFMSEPPPQTAGSDGFTSLIIVPPPKTIKVESIFIVATTADILFTMGIVTDGSGLLAPSDPDPEFRHGSYLYYNLPVAAGNTFLISTPIYLGPGHELRFMGGMVNGFGLILG